MPDRPSPEPAPEKRNSSGGSESRIDIIRAVSTPMGFFVLVVLIVEVIFGTIVAVPGSVEPTAKQTLIYGMLALILLLVFLVAGMALFRPGSLFVSEGRSTSEPPPAASAPVRPSLTSGLVDSATAQQRMERSPEIVGEEAPAPSADMWYQELRPVLHQAIHYTVPTYYLDANLRVIDWNLAFELVFSRLTGKLRGKHVKLFIAQLSNFDEVIAHAQKFSRQVYKGQIPFVDVEPLRYGSEMYGEVSFSKVAVQLHDAEGRPRGWSVSLMIREINWEAFQTDLLDVARRDKLWGVYSASYDRVLLSFPPYQKLIADVIAVVPGSDLSVIDLGAGTGNVTAALLAAGQTVTAVENNQGMLDRLRSKKLPRERLTVVKSSAESLDSLPDASFDAAVSVNMLYAVGDPLTCLQGIHRLLKPQGVLGFSTTHAEVELDPLLNSIKAHLEQSGTYEALAGDYKLVRDSNKQIEREIARRHTRDEYRDWVRSAGFEIIRDVPSTYEDAVMLIHARKK